MNRWVEIEFDCLPLRSVTRLDIPLDASPRYRARLERVKQALERHGAHNSYYLHNARCTYHLANSAQIGLLEFRFEGTVLTDTQDQTTQVVDLDVELIGETCDWLTDEAAKWFAESVRRAVKVEFDRYIAAGDLEQTRQRLAKLQQQSEESGGYLGQYL